MPTSDIFNLTDTWNAGGTTFTAIKMNVTDTASDAASLLMDLQVGGLSFFKVSKGGRVGFSNATNVGAVRSNGQTLEAVLFDGSAYAPFQALSVLIGGSNDLTLTRRGAANLRLGAADTAAPVAQTLSVQSVVAGTTNTAGTNFTFTGSQGTGTGAGGSLIFQVAPAGSSGSAQNALVPMLTVNSTGGITVPYSASHPAFVFASGANGFRFTASGFGIQIERGDAAYIARLSGTDSRFAGPVYIGCQVGGTGQDDTILNRDAANTLALRNGTAAQVFNVYNTFTDASNYERLRIFAQSAGSVIIGTQKLGTGAARGLDFQTDGATRFSLGTTGTAFFQNNAYVSTSSVLGFSTLPSGGTDQIRMSSPSDGVILFRSSGADFGRVQFGGTTSSFPAIKRSSTTLQARLADDSDFAPIQGKLTTETAYTAGTVVVTGYLTLYDSTGTAYRVPCLV